MNFGDCVKYDGRDYIFLAASAEIIYLALIPSVEHSQKFVKFRDAAYKDTVRAERADGKNYYCFIELSTADFKRRIAHYGLPEGQIGDYDLRDFMDEIGSLDLKDRKALRDAIISDGAVARILKILIEGLEIS